MQVPCQPAARARRPFAPVLFALFLFPLSLTGARDAFAAVPSRPPSTTQLLWITPDGQMAIWTLAPDGSYTSTPAYGPLPGWTATQIADGYDGSARVLWNNASGECAVWTVTPDGTVTSTPGYGPIPGWTATQIAVGGDNLTRVLWQSGTGASAVWTIATDGTFTSLPAYGPYSGRYGIWSARSLSVGSDNQTRLLWQNTIGQSAVWTIGSGGNAASTPAFLPSYYPYGSVEPLSLAVGSDNQTRLLCQAAYNSGSESAWFVWTLDSAGNPIETPPVSGPIDSWAVKQIAVGGDTLTRLLWQNESGSSAVWTLAADGAPSSTPSYGPYDSWTVVAISASP